MNIEKLRTEYANINNVNDVNKRISILTGCMEQTVDPAMASAAKRDLGLLYYMGNDTLKDVDKAKKYLSEAAEEGDELGKQFYGIALYNEGNFASFIYLREAMEMGNIYSAFMMYDNLHLKEEHALAKRVKSTVEEEIDLLVSNCQLKIERGQDEGGVPQFALALVGLYDLGAKVGIDKKKGMEYFQQALSKGNPYAREMQQNPEMMDPEKIRNFKPRQTEETRETENQYADEYATTKAPRKKGRMKTILVLAVIIAAIAVIYACREAIVNTAIAVVGAIIPVLSIAFLLVVAYVVYGDDKGSSSSKSSSSDWDPVKEYNDNKNCNNMPSCIYDSSGNRWDKQHSSENSAVYTNFDLGETTITSCDISSKSASGYGGWFHWY